MTIGIAVLLKAAPVTTAAPAAPAPTNDIANADDNFAVKGDK